MSKDEYPKFELYLALAVMGAVVILGLGSALDHVDDLWIILGVLWALVLLGIFGIGVASVYKERR